MVDWFVWFCLFGDFWLIGVFFCLFFLFSLFSVCVSFFFRGNLGRGIRLSRVIAILYVGSKKTESVHEYISSQTKNCSMSEPDKELLELLFRKISMLLLQVEKVLY